MIFESVRCDGCGFVVLNTSKYPDTWTRVLEGGETVGTFCTRSCVVGLVDHTSPGVRMPVGLVEHDVQILELLALGLSNKEIAIALSIAVSTLKNHLSVIYLALGVDDRLQVVVAAHALGLLNLPRLAEQFYASRGHTSSPAKFVRLPRAVGVRKAA